MQDLDVIVIGGGAAGIGAARTLADAGKDVLLVEADTRLGGRARTEHVDGMALDLGAGWLHSAEHNPWVEIAALHGFALDQTLPRWREQWRGLGFSVAEQREAGQAFASFEARLRTDPPPGDRAGAALTPGSPWNVWIDTVSGFVNGTDTAKLSIADYLAYENAATETDWRVPAGYGALVAAQANGLRTALATPVTSIDRSGTRLRVETSRGTLDAGQVIVTASTDVLAQGSIAIAGHDALFHAAAALPLGVADKLFLGIDHGEDDLDANAHLLGDPRNAITGTYTLRPFGRPGDRSDVRRRGCPRDDRTRPPGRGRLRHRGTMRPARRPVAPAAAAVGGLGLEPGDAYPRQLQPRPPRPRRRPPDTVDTGGSADPLRRRACSATEFSTVHGAYKTGVAAARGLLG